MSNDAIFQFAIDDYEVHNSILLLNDVFGKEKVAAFCELNAFKYQFRFKNKGKAQEDLKKAAWYNTKAAELLDKIKEDK